MQRCFGTALSACLLFAPFAAAQDMPNFTGTWKDVESSPTFERTHTIEHQDPNLKISTRTRRSGGRLGSGMYLDCSHTIDGSERTTPSDLCGASWATVRWQGSALVFLPVTKRDRSVTFTRETWTLSDDGGTLTKSRYSISPSRVTARTFVFEKQ